MAKTDSNKKQLQRSLNRLSLLEGKLIICEEGPYLMWPIKVIDPRSLLQAFQKNQRVSVSVFKKSISMQKEPYPLTPHRLAAIKLEWLVLERNPQLLKEKKEAPRFFRKHAQVDKNWLDEKEQQIQNFSTLLHQAKSDLSSESQEKIGPSWFYEVLKLIEFLHGEQAAQSWHFLFQQGLYQGRKDRLFAQKRLEQFLQQLQDHSQELKENQRILQHPMEEDSRFEGTSLQTSHLLDQEKSRQVTYENTVDEDAKEKTQDHTGKNISSDFAMFLQQATVEAKKLASRPGRARLKQLQKLVFQVMTWSPMSVLPQKTQENHHLMGIELTEHQQEGLAQQDTFSQIRALGEIYIQHLPSTRTIEYQEKLAWILSFYGLLLSNGAESIKRKKAFSQEEIKTLWKGQDFAEKHLGNSSLSIEPILLLLKSNKADWEKRELLSWLEQGLEFEKIEQMFQYHHEHYLLQDWKDIRLLRKYCDWVCALVPYGKKLGYDLKLSPNLFSQFPHEKHFDSLVLIYFVIQGKQATFGKNAEHHRALLDLSLGMLQKAPLQALWLLERLKNIPKGRGQQKFPFFSKWLHHEELLDEYLYLRTLVEEPEEISSNLLSDFSQTEKMTKELEYLTKVARSSITKEVVESETGSPKLEELDGPVAKQWRVPQAKGRGLSEQSGVFQGENFSLGETNNFGYLQSQTNLNQKQKKRLEKIQEILQSQILPDAAWTRRRLQERVTELRFLAYQKQLDILLKTILKQMIGISIPIVTTAWMNAILFYWSVNKNQDWLKVLLHFAATSPHKNIRKELPQNRAWLQKFEKQNPHFYADAWLAPRSQVIVLAGRRYVLSVEQSPIESLQMGIPFKTCLSIDLENRGSNAASSVLNAMDANKQVLYVKDEQGNIVARKLLTISSEHQLLGYRLYHSLAPELTDLLSQEVDKLIQEMAIASGLTQASSGTPEKIHEGFWYDDGVEPVVFRSLSNQEEQEKVQAYCQFLGRGVPQKISSDFEREVAGFNAARQGDVHSMLAALASPRENPSSHQIALSLLEKIGEEKAWEFAKTHSALRATLFVKAAEKSPVYLLNQVERYQISDLYELSSILLGYLPSADIARAVLTLIKSILKRAVVQPEELDEIIDQLFDLLPYHSQALSLVEFFSFCDQVDSLWQHCIQKYKQVTRIENPIAREFMRIGVQLYKKTFDSHPVIACLKRKNSSKLSRSIALKIASQFSMLSPSVDNDSSKSQQVSFSPFQMLEPEKGSVFSWQVIQKQALLEPTLKEDPIYVAAFIRQMPDAGVSKKQRNEAILPIPRSSPFAALGNLLFLENPGSSLVWEEMLSLFCQVPKSWKQPFLSKTNNHLLDGDELAEVANWSPDRYELFYHRRHFTPIRRFFAEQTQIGTVGETYKLFSVLAELGEESFLLSLQKNVRSQSQMKKIRHALSMARFINRQVQEDGVLLFKELVHFLEISNQQKKSSRKIQQSQHNSKENQNIIPNLEQNALAGSPIQRAQDLLKQNPYDFSFLLTDKKNVPIDIGFLRMVFQKLHLIYSQNQAATSAEIEACLLILVHAPLTTQESIEIASYLLDHSKEKDLEIRYIKQLLPRKLLSQYKALDGSDRLFVKLWQEEEYRDFLKQELENIYFDWDIYYRLLRLAQDGQKNSSLLRNSLENSSLLGNSHFSGNKESLDRLVFSEQSLKAYLDTLWMSDEPNQKKKRLDGLLEDWTFSCVNRDRFYALLQINQISALQRIFTWIMQKGSMQKCLEIYYDRRDFLSASLFLEILSCQKLDRNDIAQIRLQVEKDEYQDGNFFIFQQWLTEFLAFPLSKTETVVS